MQAEIRHQFVEIVGANNVLTDAEAMAPFLREWRGTFTGQAAVVVRPANTEEVAAMVRCCAYNGLHVVPQGGNTGLVGGAVAQSSENHIVLSLERMQAIRALDQANDTITVEAGCILANVQQAASEAGRLFPLSLAAEGSCRIGGNLATNAGGLNVLHYGNTRDLCLGLEVVLPDGEIWSGLAGLRKDNSGYDLKHLFIGSEGSLGVITAATFKLFPQPRQRETAMMALPDTQSAISVLKNLRQDTGDNLIACELIPRFAVELTTRHIERCRDPFEAPHAWYLLIEAATPAEGQWLQEAIQASLEAAMENELLEDVLLAQSLQQAEDFWRIRENIPAAQVAEGASVKHDVSVPVSDIPEFLQRAQAAVEQAVPGVRVCAFGHVGDGNLHFNLSQPCAMAASEFVEKTNELNQIVHSIVVDMGGSFAAEHGVGRLKAGILPRYKSATEVALMRRIKTALDPENTMNPGVIVQS